MHLFLLILALARLFPFLFQLSNGLINNLGEHLKKKYVVPYLHESLVCHWRHNYLSESLWCMNWFDCKGPDLG